MNTLPYKRIDHEFPEDQYFKNFTEKHQIVLHHTASGLSPDGDINWWKKTKERIATCLIGSRNSDLHTLFWSRYWAHHLGVKVRVFDQQNIKRIYQKNPITNKYFVANNLLLNQHSLGYELDSWGWLEKINNKYFNYLNKEIQKENVIDYGEDFRGYRYYESYTQRQIDTLKHVLLYWKKTYNIPVKYDESIWDVCKKALKGEKGLYTHVSYRNDKTDCHPDPKLIKMLKNLN